MHLKMSSVKCWPFCLGLIVYWQMLFESIWNPVSAKSLDTLRLGESGYHFADISNALLWMKTFEFGIEFYWYISWRSNRWCISIGIGNGLVPSGSKPLPEPMLTKIHDAIWHTSLSELTLCPRDTIRWHQVRVNIGSGNGLLPDGTKPFPGPMLNYHQ